MSRKNRRKKSKMLPNLKRKLNVNGKWIDPSESLGSEDFKTGIAFMNWSNMKSISSKTRKVEKSQFQFLFSARGKKVQVLFFKFFVNPVIFSSNLMSQDIFYAKFNWLSEYVIGFEISTMIWE